MILIDHYVYKIPIRTALHINAINLTSRVELVGHTWFLNNTLLDPALLLVTGLTTLYIGNDLLHGDVGIDLLQLVELDHCLK